MGNLIQGARDAFGKMRPKRRESPPSSSAPGDTYQSSLTEEQFFGSLYREYRTEDPNGRLLLNRTWFRSALYFQGKQQVSWNEESGSLDFFDPLPGEDWYNENQYRRDVIANVSSMSKAEVPPQSAPASDRPDDVAASRCCMSAMEVIRDDTDHERGKVLKNLNLCLFGNAFKYQVYVKDSRNYGTTVIPTYEIQDNELPGVHVCSNCGNTTDGDKDQICDMCGAPMEMVASPETIQSKVETGEQEIENGRNQEIVTGPLEMYMRSKVSHGLKYQPYLFWVRRIDSEIVKDARPKVLNQSGGIGMDQDLSQYYIDVLSTLSGGPYEGVYTTSSARFYKEVEFAMCWIRPEAFKGREDLKKKYPDGAMFEACNGKVVPGSIVNQSMDDHWTHFLYTPNPYSAWGDGMVDALPVQDQINEVNSLYVSYLRHCTVGKHIYDQDVIIPEWLSNNPSETWIPGQRQIDKKLSESVFSINPTPMAQDVGAWKGALMGTFHDMTHAYDASQGKSLGSNTPYSSYVFQAEQAAVWFLAMFQYNKASSIQAARQQLNLFRDNVSEKRTRKFKDNTGKWSFDQFMGSDLQQGSFDIYISDTEGVPKSKAEKAHGLELYAQFAPIMPTLSQKQRVYVLDTIGMPPDANPDTLMSQKAYRDIEAIVKRGEQIVPNAFVLDVPVYVKTIKEYLAGEDGDTLAEENSQAFISLFNLMISVMQQGMMMNATMPPMSGPEGPDQQQQPKGQPKPAGKPGQPGGKPQQNEKAQSPVPPSQQIDMPTLPAGARQQPQ